MILYQKINDISNVCSKAVFFYMSNWSNLAKCCNNVLECNINVVTLSKYNM
jgi:hypothetical protein